MPYLLCNDVLYTYEPGILFRRIIYDALMEVCRAMYAEVMCLDMATAVSSATQLRSEIESYFPRTSTLTRRRGKHICADELR